MRVWVCGCFGRHLILVVRRDVEYWGVEWPGLCFACSHVARVGRARGVFIVPMGACGNLHACNRPDAFANEASSRIVCASRAGYLRNFRGTDESLAYIGIWGRYQRCAVASFVSAILVGPSWQCCCVKTESIRSFSAFDGDISCTDGGKFETMGYSCVQWSSHWRMNLVEHGY